MITEGWNIIWTATQWYFSNGYYWTLLICAVAFVLMNHKQKSVFFVVCYMVICGLLVFNPLVALALSKFGMDGVYWRIYWIYPIGFVIAYMFTKIVSYINVKFIKVMIVALSIFVITKCGRFTYNSWNFQVAENSYKISKSVIEVSDYIEPGNAVLAPLDLLCWLRTYNADIYFPIGRQEIFFTTYSERHHIVELLSNDEVLDVYKVAEFATKNGCRYVVYRKYKQVEGNWEDFGYSFVGQTPSYYIYAK